MRHERRGVPPAVPPAGEDYLRAWRARHDVAAWRAADQVLRRSPAGPARRAHEEAVAVALARLQRFGSVEALIEHARVDRYRRSTDAGDPPDGSVEAWVGAARRAAGEGGTLDPSLVEGAALWRRVAQLMGDRSL
jgi:hypothetical protein